MELEKFIEETLISVSQGVSKANLAVCEAFHDKDSVKIFGLEPGNDKSSGIGISFDVAITTQNDSKSQGGGKVKIAVFEANLSGGESIVNKNISRVQFNVSIKKWHG